MFGKIKNTIGRLIGTTKSAATATATTVVTTAKSAVNATANVAKAAANAAAGTATVVGGAITRRTRSVAMAFSSESAMTSVARFRQECRDCLDNLWGLAGEVAASVGPWLAIAGFAAMATGFVNEAVGLLVGPLLIGGWALASLSLAYIALSVACSLIMGLQEVVGDLLVATSSRSYDFESVNDANVVDAVAACPAVAIV